MRALWPLPVLLGLVLAFFPAWAQDLTAQERTVRHLEGQLDRARSLEEQSQKRIQILNQELARLDSRVQKLLKEKARLEGEITRLEKERATLRGQIASLKEEIR
ncbi:MAG: peptidase M23, partial [Thermus sp.]|nr:peptidase M23 [Thermus sp.]